MLRICPRVNASPGRDPRIDSCLNLGPLGLVVHPVSPIQLPLHINQAKDVSSTLKLVKASSAPSATGASNGGSLAIKVNKASSVNGAVNEDSLAIKALSCSQSGSLIIKAFANRPCSR